MPQKSATYRGHAPSPPYQYRYVRRTACRWLQKMKSGRVFGQGRLLPRPEPGAFEQPLRIHASHQPHAIRARQGRRQTDAGNGALFERRLASVVAACRRGMMRGFGWAVHGGGHHFRMHADLVRERLHRCRKQREHNQERGEDTQHDAQLYNLSPGCQPSGSRCDARPQVPTLVVERRQPFRNGLYPYY